MFTTPESRTTVSSNDAPRITRSLQGFVRGQYSRITMMKRGGHHRLTDFTMRCGYTKDTQTSAILLTQHTTASPVLPAASLIVRWTVDNHANRGTRKWQAAGAGQCGVNWIRGPYADRCSTRPTGTKSSSHGDWRQLMSWPKGGST